MKVVYRYTTVKRQYAKSPYPKNCFRTRFSVYGDATVRLPD